MPERSVSSWKYTRLAYTLVVLAWCLFAVLTLTAPEEAGTRYHMSELNLGLLRLTVIVPIHLVWLIAVRGAAAFKGYAQAIKGSRESDGINQIANGLLWTLATLVAQSVVGSIEPFFVHSTIAGSIIVLHDHLPAYMGLVGFMLLYIGSHQLRNVAQFTTWTRSTVWTLVGFIAFSVVFVLEFATSTASSATMASRNSTSFIPLGILLFTLVLPYLAAWFMGILASVNIYKFSRSVKGILYRRALSNLVRGIVGIVAFAIAVQLITFSDQFLSNISIGFLLIVVYALIALYAVGFVFIWMGARQLERLEAPE